MNLILEKIVSAFVDKKRVIGWVSAVGLAVGALAASMSTQEFKDAVCSAPVIQVPTAPAGEAK